MCEALSRHTVITRRPSGNAKKAVIEARVVELNAAIRKDDAEGANGKYALGFWKQSLITRGCLPRIGRMPGIVLDYLARQGVTTHYRVLFADNGDIIEVTSHKGAATLELGIVLCPAEHAEPLAEMTALVITA